MRASTFNEGSGWSHITKPFLKYLFKTYEHVLRKNERVMMNALFQGEKDFVEYQRRLAEPLMNILGSLNKIFYVELAK